MLVLFRNHQTHKQDHTTERVSSQSSRMIWESIFPNSRSLKMGNAKCIGNAYVTLRTERDIRPSRQSPLIFPSHFRHLINVCLMHPLLRAGSPPRHHYCVNHVRELSNSPFLSPLARTLIGRPRGQARQARQQARQRTGTRADKHVGERPLEVSPLPTHRSKQKH